MWKSGGRTLSPLRVIVTVAIAITCLVVGIRAIVYVAGLPNGGLTTRAIGLRWALVTMFTFFPVAIVLLRAFTDIRLWILQRRFPNALVTGLMRTTDLQNASTQLDIIRQPPSYEQRFPAYLALVADSAGISLWGGIFRPHDLWVESWSNVEYVELGQSFSGSHNLRAIELGIRIGEDVVAINLTFLGSRFGGFKLASKREIAEIRDVLLSIQQGNKVRD